MLTVLIPIRAVSTMNLREHFMAKAKRAKRHRTAAYMGMRCAALTHAVPCTVTLTRIGVRQLDDDNLAASMKAARDGIADWLKVDDGDARVKWLYDQRRGKPKEYAVEVTIA